ncbi:MAG: hypothetical protein GYA24_12390 [Candidatus Lokiarchaeota archaeon]|nr:hypothetical protein [Candidatus Lokiarchaeota archaeon]
MVLITFNCKGIDELTGNPPILIDAPENKIFKDVLLEVIDKLNPLLPGGKKLALDRLGIESFDGEPVSLAMYEKPVADITINFGTSFVVTLADDQVFDAETIMSDVLTTEGVPPSEAGLMNGPPSIAGGGPRPIVHASGSAPSPPGVAGPPPMSTIDASQPALPALMKTPSDGPTRAFPVPPSKSEEREERNREKTQPMKKTEATAKKSMYEQEEEITTDDGTSGLQPAKTQYDKNISVDYFDVMNPENYYPIVVDIADIEQAWKPVQENIITGERKVQVKEQVVFETDTVLVRPVFPGCTVAPSELEADLTKPKEVLTFYATPLVKGGIKGELHFLANGKIVHKTELPAQVQDPRFGRMITLYGLIASMVPKLSSLFSIDLGAMISAALGISLSGDVLTSIIAIAGTGIASFFGMIYYLTHRPKNTRLQLHVSDFRLSIVPLNVP